MVPLMILRLNMAPLFVQKKRLLAMKSYGKLWKHPAGEWPSNCHMLKGSQPQFVTLQLS